MKYNENYGSFPKMMKLPSADEVYVLEPELILEDLSNDLESTHKSWLRKLFKL